MFAMAKITDHEPLVAELAAIAGVRLNLDEPLARYTSMKIGGPADYFIEVDTGAALAAVLLVASPPSSTAVAFRQRQQCAH